MTDQERDALQSAKAFINLWIDFRLMPASDFNRKYGRDYTSREVMQLARTLREKLTETLTDGPERSERANADALVSKLHDLLIDAHGEGSPVNMLIWQLHDLLRAEIIGALKRDQDNSL